MSSINILQMLSFILGYRDNADVATTNIFMDWPRVR